MKTALYIAGGAGLIGIANLYGFWQATFLVGILFALLFAGTGRAVWTSLVAGAFGWALPLAAFSLTREVGAMAQLVGEILGLGGTLALLAGWLLPPVIGMLLALCSAWVIGAIRQAVGQAKGVKAVQKRSA